MRIPNKVVCLWSCLTAFTFIHTAVAQDYRAEPLSGAGNSGVTAADYAGSAILGDMGAEEAYEPEYAPMAFNAQGADPGSQGFYPPPLTQGYPPPMAPPNAGYWPEVSPFAEPIVDKTYRQNGVWVNEGIHGHRDYFFSTEYLRVGFNRPGTDIIGARNVGMPENLIGFRAVNAGVFAGGDDLLSDGIRAKFSMRNPDTTSLEMSGFWIGESLAEFQPFAPARAGDTSTFRRR